MLKILSILDDEKCYDEVRVLRWPNGVICPCCSSAEIVKNGHHETNQYRQRYLCNLNSRKNCSYAFLACFLPAA